MSDFQRAFVGGKPIGAGFAILDGDTKKSAFAAEIAMHRMLAGISAVGMFVIDGAAAELDEAGAGVLGAILPMAIAADDVGVFHRREEITELLALVEESFV